MKVVFIAHYCVVSEYQKKLQELSKFNDLDITLIVPKAWTEGSRLVALERKYSPFYKIIPVFIIGRDHISSFFPPFLFLHILKIKPDIIHIDEEPFSLCAFYAVLLAKFVKAKIIIYSFENIKRKYKFPLGLVEKFVLKNTDYAIVASKEAKEILKEKGYKKEISIVAQVAVDEDFFKPLDKENLKKKHKLEGLVIGYIGRLTEEKGIITLLKAVKLLDKYEFKVLIIGSGPLESTIKEFQKNLDKKIILKQAMPQRELIKYLNCMDILVLPSYTTRDWKEQFGRVLIEAMACEVVTVGSSSGAIPEIVDKNGLIFKEKDEKDLVEKLELLIKNEKLRRELSKKAREYVLEKFTYKRIASEIYKIYKKITQKSKI